MKKRYSLASRVACARRFSGCLRLLGLLVLLLSLPVLAQAQTPIITSFSPTSGPIGTSVTITGTDLGSASSVSFNGTAQTSFTSNSATQLVLNVPSGATTGPLTVTTPGGTSAASSQTFTVCAAPVALAQNVSLTLDVNGNATLAATAVNNGSTANCGPAAAGALSVSPSAFSCTDAVPATVASALVFGGTSQYITVAPGNSLPIGNSSYTLEAWIKPTSMGVYGIVGYGTYNTGPQVNAFRLSPNNGGELVNYWWGPDLIVPTGNLADGQWHHVAATYNGTTRTIYVDGVVKGSDVPGVAHAVPNASNATIGSTNNGEYFCGSLDEVRVWNVARTQAQLSAAKGIGLPGGSAGLVAYYRFNEGSGLTTADATGNAANLGTLVNGPTWTTRAAPVTNGVPVTLTVTDNGNATSTATAIVTVSVPATPTTTWNGSSTDWTGCTNWSYGKVPDAATNAVIPTGQPRYPSLASGTFPVLDLTIDSGGSLTLASGATLQINGSFANNGTTSLPGTVAFAGSTAQRLGGSTATAFTTVAVNKASGTVTLTHDLAIAAALTLSSGTLTTTGTYRVALGTAATLDEKEASYVVGQVALTRTLVPGTAEAFSGLGLTLTPAAGSTAPGTTVVSRTTGTPLTGAGTSQSMLRYFDIQPATNTGLNVTMDFAYFDHELNGISAANLVLFKSVTTTAGPWAPQRPATLAPNVVSKAGIADFSVWTLGNSANPLPVELAAFTARAEGTAAVRLAWATASEKNSAHFDVERSLTGTVFARIGTVAAAGTSSNARAYGFVDAKLPLGAVLLYYRLRQADLDGTFSYSPVRRVVSGQALADAGLALFPNPAHGGAATLTGATPGTVVAVLDALGRQVTSATADANGTATLVLPAGLATGMYVVRVGAKALRLTVE